MNKDNFPSESSMPLLNALITRIQPGLRMVEKDLALAGEAGDETCRHHLLAARARLAELGANLERVIADYGQPAPVGNSEGAPDSLSPPGKGRILFAPHARQHRRQYLKILLVEDNLVSNAITKAMLEQQGWRVSGVLSGRQALEKLMVKAAYDLIIADLAMDGMSGLELAGEIRRFEREDPSALAHSREGRPPVPIIAFTANDAPAILDECSRVGIDDMVVKSTRLDSLIACIEKQIAKVVPPLE